MSESLYHRLGGEEKIAAIVNDLVDYHLANPAVAARFAGADVPRLKKTAADFVVTGTGGPQVYTGKDMRAAHAHMNISDAEFMAVVDDVMASLDKHAVGQREKEEVLFILYSLRPDVVHV